MKSGSDTGRAR